MKHKFVKGHIPWNKGGIGPNKGKKFSLSWRKKLSEAKKGKKAGMTGKHHSNDTKAKLRVKNINKIISLETRLKISKTLKEKAFTLSQWKGGITPIEKTIRESLKYSTWRQAGFKRDNYTCQICNNKGGRLNFDHFPIPFSFIINKLKDKYGIKNLYKSSQNCKLLWSLANGRTLCEPCHKKTDSYLNRWYNYKLNIALDKLKQFDII